MVLLLIRLYKQCLCGVLFVPKKLAFCGAKKMQRVVSARIACPLALLRKSLKSLGRKEARRNVGMLGQPQLGMGICGQQFLSHVPGWYKKQICICHPSIPLLKHRFSRFFCFNRKLASVQLGLTKTGTVPKGQLWCSSWHIPPWWPCAYLVDVVVIWASAEPTCRRKDTKPH